MLALGDSRMYRALAISQFPSEIPPRSDASMLSVSGKYLVYCKIMQICLLCVNAAKAAEYVRSPTVGIFRLRQCTGNAGI